LRGQNPWQTRGFDQALEIDDFLAVSDGNLPAHIQQFDNLPARIEIGLSESEPDFSAKGLDSRQLTVPQHRFP
jgi:hypothetical protein